MGKYPPTTGRCHYDLPVADIVTNIQGKQTKESDKLIIWLMLEGLRDLAKWQYEEYEKMEQLAGILGTLEVHTTRIYKIFGDISEVLLPAGTDGAIHLMKKVKHRMGFILTPEEMATVHKYMTEEPANPLKEDGLIYLALSFLYQSLHPPAHDVHEGNIPSYTQVVTAQTLNDFYGNAPPAPSPTNAQPHNAPKSKIEKVTSALNGLWEKGVSTLRRIGKFFGYKRDKSAK